jgi:hypothetical protein
MIQLISVHAENETASSSTLSTMTTEQLTRNKETVRQFYQTIYRSEIDKAFSLYATPNMEWTVASPNSPETMAVLPWVGVIHRGAEGFKQLCGATLRQC